MRKCKYHPYIDDYIMGIHSGEILVGKDMKLAVDYIEKKLDDPDVIIDNEMIDKAVELIEKYFDYSMFDWSSSSLH